VHYLFFTLFLLHLTSHTQVYYLSSCFISRRAAGTCPTVKSMYISLYSSSYCIRPALTWAISISAVERMEMVGPCLLGWRFGAANPFSAGPLSSFVASHSVSPNLKPIQPGGHVWRDCAFSPSAAWKQPCARAQCFSSSPAQLRVVPAEEFALVANALTELLVYVRPATLPPGPGQTAQVRISSRAIVCSWQRDSLSSLLFTTSV